MRVPYTSNRLVIRQTSVIGWIPRTPSAVRNAASIASLHPLGDSSPLDSVVVNGRSRSAVLAVQGLLPDSISTPPGLLALRRRISPFTTKATRTLPLTSKASYSTASATTKMGSDQSQTTWVGAAGAAGVDLRSRDIFQPPP